MGEKKKVYFAKYKGFSTVFEAESLESAQKYARKHFNLVGIGFAGTLREAKPKDLKGWSDKNG